MKQYPYQTYSCLYLMLVATQNDLSRSINRYGLWDFNITLTCLTNIFDNCPTLADENSDIFVRDANFLFWHFDYNVFTSMIVKLLRLIASLKMKAFCRIQGDDVFLAGSSIHLLMVYEGCCTLRSHCDYSTWMTIPKEIASWWLFARVLNGLLIKIRSPAEFLSRLSHSC